VIFLLEVLRGVLTCFPNSIDLTNVPADLSTTWLVEYDDAAGNHHVVDGVPGLAGIGWKRRKAA